MSRAAPPGTDRPLDGAGTVRVDIAWFTRAWILGGGIVLTAFGGSAVGGAIAGLTTDPAVAERVIVGVLGAGFLLAGLGMLAWRFGRPPRTFLEIDSATLRAVDRGGVEWSLGWGELTRLELVRTRGRAALGFAAGGAAGGASAGYVRFPRHYLVLGLPRGATRPESLASAGPAHVDLGVLPSTARRVAAALGPRLPDPRPRHLDRAETERLLA